LLLKLLANSPPITAEDARSVRSLWLASRKNPRESLTEFLVRIDVFVPDAIKTMDMLRKGLITYCDPRRLLKDDGYERLRQRLGGAPAGAPATTPMTATGTTTMRPSSKTGIAAPPPAAAATLGSKAGDTKDVIDATATGAPSAGPAIGSMLGNCLLTEQIGKGGSSQVFRAIHRGLNIPVAVKVLKREALEKDQRVYTQLKAEAQMLRRLQHPNIIRVLEFDDNPKFPYLVLEYVEGLSLAELINQSGRLRLDRAVVIIRQIADGLNAALKLGVIHRDVKPANVLLTRDGSAKLADMGLAVVIIDRTNAPAANPISGTNLESLAGTVAYISPEQALSSPNLDHRGDIYSLGATFYHAVTGELPFKGRTRMEVILKHVQEAPIPPHLLVPGLDPTVSQVILTAMAKDPAARFQKYEDFLHGLDSLQDRQDAAMELMNTTSINPAITLPK
jgi:tRNA A-37 threonylcarbamoyl transferase component Bud32